MDYLLKYKKVAWEVLDSTFTSCLNCMKAHTMYFPSCYVSDEQQPFAFSLRIIIIHIAYYIRSDQKGINLFS